MRATWILVAGLALTACVAPAEDGGGLDTDDVVADDSKADGELRVRIDGITVWFDPGVTRVGGDRPWRINGRASRNLDDVMSFIPDDEFGQATTITSRTFQIALDDDALGTIASGRPLFLQLRPMTGEPATAAIWLAPRLGAFTGTSKLRLDTTVAPRWVGGEVTYRGGGRSDAGWFVTSTGPTAPQVFLGESANRWRFDWTSSQFLGGATAPFQLHAQRSDVAAGKQAAPAFAIRRLGLTRLDAYDVWPAACESAVRTCLAMVPAGTVDAGTCGTFHQVAECGGLLIGAAPSVATVAADLRARMVEYYEDHPDTVENGGNTMAQAQAAVDAAAVVPVTLAEEDPNAHDLGTFWVFRHPDVVFPGSDTAWFLAYDKATGALALAYDFN